MTKTSLLMAASLLALAGAAPAIAQDKEITFINCGDELTAGYADYFKEWEAANPGFKVVPEVVGWGQCQDKVTTLAAAGTPVALAYVGSRTLKQFAQNDLIVPVPMTDRAIFDRLVFPRLSAIAETGWTPKASKSWKRFSALVGLMPNLYGHWAE